jgi:succinate dehydrogenase/fumarate reductase cytochrome b subunit
VGYIGYFCLPAVIGAALGRRLSARFNWRGPITLLIVGFVVGFCWALLFNAGVGARLGVFHYAYVIPGLGLFEGTLHQYPIYDAIAMGIQMMVFTYLLGRTDSQGRNVIEMWSDKMSKTRLQSAILSVVAVIVIGNMLYGAVFAPHLVTKLNGYVTSGPSGQLFPGVANQPR